MVQFSTFILFGVVAFSVCGPAILAVPIEQSSQELEARDVLDGNSIENLEARDPASIASLLAALRNKVKKRPNSRMKTSPAVNAVNDKNNRMQPWMQAMHRTAQAIHNQPRGIEDINEMEARSNFVHAVKTLMKNGGARRVITSPVRDGIHGAIRGAEANKHKEAHEHATANIKKWHEATRKIIHQQHENNKNRPREYVDELDGRDEFEDLLEAREDWELDDMD